MTVRQPRYSKEEFARRGDEIYETQVRPKVEAGNHGKIVAIDIETGDFEVDPREIAACDRLEARNPDAQRISEKFFDTEFCPPSPPILGGTRINLLVEVPQNWGTNGGLD
ncbi:hypothetical protein, partial [Moorena sp. SIO2C4]